VCLAIPMKITAVHGDMADVELGGVTRKVSVKLVSNPKPGMYIIAHAGFAIEVMHEDEALETLKLLEELSEISDGISKQEANAKNSEGDPGRA
jgi:hydrogenase expression/formation protein HypC